MLTRQPSEISRRKAKSHLKKLGWTYREVSRPNGPLKVTFEHLCRVLTGVRESRRLLSSIFELPSRDEFLAKQQNAGETTRTE